MEQPGQRGRTTRSAVVNAALRIVDQVGIDALTIRAVAALAGTPPMSLYSHFANKRELIDFMCAEVAFRLYADPGHPTWQGTIRALCHQIRTVLLEHPRWLPLLSRPVEPMALPLRERVLTMMTADGVAPQDAIASLTGASLTSLGFTLLQLSFRDPSAAFTTMSPLAVDQTFELSVSTFIVGLEARLPGAE